MFRNIDWFIALGILMRLAIMALAFAAGVLVVTFLPGCGGALSAPWRGTIPDLGGVVPSGSGPLAALNWVLPLSVLGIAGSIFALVIPGISKSFGFAGLLASVSAAVFTIVLVKYACFIAIIGVIAGLGTVVMAVIRNRGTIYGLIDGFQAVKDGVVDVQDDRAAANEVMAKHLPKHTKAIVAKRKNGNGKS